ncbi:MAG: hypothetical protein VX615_04515 [Planctomycetota bacterium]|nr:hypothetical protein [Planctomycetota bacterium]
MLSLPFIQSLLFGVYSLHQPDQTGWKPEIYNCIKWTEPNQGAETIAYTKAQGITRVPIAYHGGVDTNASGKISQENIQQFSKWVNRTIPIGYEGPIVLDYEAPWWLELRAKTISKTRLNEICAVYEEGLEVAKSLRPNAQWGYWGLPSGRHTNPEWLNQGLSLSTILNGSNAIYPEVYDCNKNATAYGKVQDHIETALEQTGGKQPVYVYVSPRYCGENGDRSHFVPDDDFLHHVNAALQASWTNAKGKVYKVQGIILWDAYGYSPREEWSDLDMKHTKYFELLVALSNAWKESTKDAVIKTGNEEHPLRKYGLHKTLNSSDTLDAPLSKPEKHVNKNKPELTPSERIPSGRIPN